MRKLHVLVLRTYMGPFLMAFGVILFLMVMQFMSLYINDIAGKGLSLEVLLKMFYYATERLIVLSLPISLLTGALMTMGSMGENYELAAIKSSGISLFRLAMPLFVLSIVLSVGCIYLSSYRIPLSTLKFFSLLYDVQRKKAEVAIQPGYFYGDIDGYIIRITDKNKETGMMYGFILYNHSENRGNVDIIYADSARMMLEPGYSQIRLVLYKGARYEELPPSENKQAPGKDNHPFARTAFDSLYYRIDLTGFSLDRTDEQLFSRHQMTMIKDSLEIEIKKMKDERAKDFQTFQTNMRAYNGLDSATLFKKIQVVATDTLLDTVVLAGKELFFDKIKVPNRLDVVNRAIGSVRSLRSNIEFRETEKQEDAKNLSSYQYELYSMFALPCTCIMFMLLGVAFGAIIRKGGLGLPSLISIIFFVVYYALVQQGRKFVKDGFMSPEIGATLPLIVFLPIAIVVVFQATMDASLFDESTREMMKERIIDFFRKLFRIKTTA